LDMFEKLIFDDSSLEEAYKSHAANQCFFESLAVQLKNVLDEFEDIFEEKWWAHNKQFAKYVLLAYGEPKPTMETIKDMTISIYSVDTKEVEREKYVELAFSAVNKNRVIFEGTKDEFRSNMLKYILANPPWYFESLERTIKQQKLNYEIVSVFAKRLDSKSFHMKEYLNLVTAKASNVGPLTYSDKKKERELIDLLSASKQKGV